MCSVAFHPDYLTAPMTGQTMSLWKVFYRLPWFASLSFDTAHLDRYRSEELNRLTELYIITFSLEPTDSSSVHSPTRYYYEGTTRACC